MKLNSFSLVALLFLTIGSVAFIHAQDDLTKDPFDLRNKNVLIVYGGWEGHKPDLFAKRMSKWTRENGANVTVSDALDIYTDASVMKNVDLIIQYWTMGEITEDQKKGLLKAVRSGAGIVGCHGGIGDSFRQNTDYQYMIGGQWVSHPGGMIDYSVQITDSEDPITQGIADFKIENTEQYYMHVDPNVKVLATTTFSGKHDDWIKGASMPVVWKKYYDKGRVFYISIGHSPEDFDHPAVWTLLTRGIKWAVNSKYQAQETWLSPVYSE